MAQQRRSLEDIFSGQQARPTIDEAMGLTAPAKGENVLDSIKKWYGENISAPLDTFAAGVRNVPDASVMDAPRPDRGLERALAPLVAGAAETVAHPVQNAPTILGLAAQFNPVTRAIMNSTKLAKASPMVRGLAQAGANTASAAAGGGLGGFIAEGPEGVLPNALEQGGYQLAGEGTMLGGGAALRGLGRGAGYLAMLPSKAERAAVWMGEKGTSKGFTPGRGRKLVKDLMFERGEGSIGGDTYVKTIEDRLAKANAENDAIVAATRGQFPEPSPARYNVNIPNATRGVKGMGNAAAKTGGLTPSADRDQIWSTVENFLNRDAGAARPEVRGLLTEGTRNVPLGQLDEALGSASTVSPSASRGNSVRPSAIDRPVGLDDYRSGNVDAPGRFGPDANPVDALNAQTLGEAQSSLAPTSSLEWPRQFKGEGTAPAHTPGIQGPGTVELPGIVVSPRQPVLPRAMDDATFEEALAILRNIDKDLTSTMQQKVANASGRSESYIPSASERAGAQIRRNLREDINAVAPEAPTGRTHAEVNADITRDMPWLRLASDATDEVSNRGVGGTIGSSGRPRISLTDLLQQLSGAVARPTHAAGNAAITNSAKTTQMGRLLAQLLAPSHPQSEQR